MRMVKKQTKNIVQRNQPKQSTTMKEAKHKKYDVSSDTSPSKQLLIINILNNTLITYLPSFKNIFSKQR